jgi:hypothetical protein
MSADVMDAFNTEALKLAAMGVTVVVSSGDDGVAGRADRCGDDSGSDNSDWQVRTFGPLCGEITIQIPPFARYIPNQCC